jgi:hypothetical protein
MKILIYFLLLFVSFIQCKEDKKERKEVSSNLIKTNSSDTCINYDDLLLKYANQFKAVAVCLDESISPELRNFLNKIDTNCLRKQNQYKFFISLIIAKLHSYHVDCCELGSNLLCMKNGAARLLINEYQTIAGYTNVREFLNSATIVSFIKHDSSLNINTILRKQIEKFDDWKD